MAILGIEAIDPSKKQDPLVLRFILHPPDGHIPPKQIEATVVDEIDPATLTLTAPVCPAPEQRPPPHGLLREPAVPLTP
jgi:hypothetical protein